MDSSGAFHAPTQKPVTATKPRLLPYPARARHCCPAASRAACPGRACGRALGAHPIPSALAALRRGAAASRPEGVGGGPPRASGAAAGAAGERAAARSGLDLLVAVTDLSGNVRQPGAIRAELAKMPADTEWTWVHTHVMRKTVATLLAREHDSEAAADQLGHADDETTRRSYIEKMHATPDVRHVLDRLAA